MKCHELWDAENVGWKIWNVTHKLFIILKDDTPCHKVYNITHLLFGHRKRSDETPIHRLCNITHFLPLVIRKDVMRLPFTKCHSQAVSVTINTLYAPMRRYPVCFSLLLYYDATLPMLD